MSESFGGTAARTVLLAGLFFLCLAACPASAQTRGNWFTYSTAGEPAAEGLDISVKIPVGYLIAPEPKPRVLKEFFVVNEETRNLSYMTITILGLDRKLINGLLKSSDGSWLQSSLSAFWRSMAQGLDGAKSYNEFFFQSSPAADVVVEQSQTTPYPAFRQVDTRIVIYGNQLVKLECGDISPDASVNEHARNKPTLCHPFFNSLTMN
ncbi:MAG: hypothetical protein LBO05_08255 [Deltaproteobacteria bacterium]|jgi:hypothetical protein|nr:hypothetical protein [Deltaproteobacteria bacterium]